MSSSGDDIHDIEFQMEYDVEEDYEAELEDFVRLAHMRQYDEAYRLFERYFGDVNELDWYPAVAEYCDCLLQQCQFDRLEVVAAAARLRFTEHQEHQVFRLLETISSIRRGLYKESNLQDAIDNLPILVWKEISLVYPFKEPKDVELHLVWLILHVATNTKDDTNSSMLASKIARIKGLKHARVWDVFRYWFSNLLEYKYFWEAHQILQELFTVLPMEECTPLVQEFLEAASTIPEKNEALQIAVSADIQHSLWRICVGIAYQTFVNPWDDLVPPWNDEITRALFDSALISNEAEVVTYFKNIDIIDGIESCLGFSLPASLKEGVAPHKIPATNTEVYALVNLGLSLEEAIHGGTVEQISEILASSFGPGTIHGEIESGLQVTSELTWSEDRISQARSLLLGFILLFAIDRGRRDVLPLLMAGGADTSVKDIFYHTALHVAAQIGREDIILFLLDNTDLEVTHKDWLGQTPIDWALNNDHAGAAKYLRRAKRSALVAKYLGRAERSAKQPRATLEELSEQREIDSIQQAKTPSLSTEERPESPLLQEARTALMVAEAAPTMELGMAGDSKSPATKIVDNNNHNKLIVNVQSGLLPKLARVYRLCFAVGAMVGSRTPISIADIRKVAPFMLGTEPDGSVAMSLVENGKATESKQLYNYAKIQANETRLLTLLPGRFDSPITGLLDTVPLKNLSKWRYEALSYVWGSADDQIMIKLFNLNTSDAATSSETLELHDFCVRPNLVDALRQLRDTKKPRILWIDAISINRSDTRELAWQASVVAGIYKNAREVQVWLGQGNDTLAEALPFIPRILDLSAFTDPVSSDFVKFRLAIRELLSLRWFHRRWVILEIAMARKASLIYGSHTCTWEDFVDALGLAATNLSEFTTTLSRTALILLDASRIFFQRSQSDSTVVPLATLEQLVYLLRSFEVADPRDTIFALIPISRPPAESQPHTPRLSRIETSLHFRYLEPNYSKPVLQVYKEFVRECIDQSHSLDILLRPWATDQAELSWTKGEAAASNERRQTRSIGTMPSWISIAETDSSESKAVLTRFVSAPGLRIYNAATGNYKPNFTMKQVSRGRGEDYLIRVKALPLGTIDDTSHVISADLISTEALKKILNLGGIKMTYQKETPPTIPERFWRTLVAGRALDETPAPTWYRRALLHTILTFDAESSFDLSTARHSSPLSDYHKSISAPNLVPSLAIGTEHSEREQRQELRLSSEGIKDPSIGSQNLTIGSPTRILEESGDVSAVGAWDSVVVTERPQSIRRQGISYTPDRKPMQRDSTPTYVDKHIWTYETGHPSSDSEQLEDDVRDLSMPHDKHDPTTALLPYANPQNKPPLAVFEYWQRVRTVVRNRRVFTASPSFSTPSLPTSLLGLAPSAAQVGDKVVLFFGCSVPVILRPNYKEETDGKKTLVDYSLIGEAYVDCVMEGEVLEGMSKEEVTREERDFLIR